MSDKLHCGAVCARRLKRSDLAGRAPGNFWCAPCPVFRPVRRLAPDGPRSGERSYGVRATRAAPKCLPGTRPCDGTCRNAR